MVSSFSTFQMKNSLGFCLNVSSLLVDQATKERLIPPNHRIEAFGALE